MARDNSDFDLDTEIISIRDVIKAVQALPNMDDELILEACDFLENQRQADIFMALSPILRRKWLIKKLTCRISVRTVGGRDFYLDVLASEKIAEVKAEIGAKTGIFPENQSLTSTGEREMEDDRTLADYGVPRFPWLFLFEIPKADRNNKKRGISG